MTMKVNHPQQMDSSEPMFLHGGLLYPLYPHRWHPNLSTSMLALAPEDSISLAASDGSADVRSAQRSLQAVRG